jgi:mRNA interferase HicA
MKRRDLIRYLESQGCELLSEGGRHSWWHNSLQNKRSAVPRHHEINAHLVRKICSDLGIAKP